MNLSAHLITVCTTVTLQLYKIITISINLKERMAILNSDHSASATKVCQWVKALIHNIPYCGVAEY